MAYRCDGLDFSVLVEGRFVRESTWEVHAVVVYRADADSPRSQRSLVAARSSLVAGLLREAREGRRLGAALVRGRIEGDPSVVGVFAASRSYSAGARAA